VPRRSPSLPSSAGPLAAKPEPRADTLQRAAVPLAAQKEAVSGGEASDCAKSSPASTPTRGEMRG
jgi:hypothetical protein